MGHIVRLSSAARHAAGQRPMLGRKHHRQRLRPSHHVNRRAWRRVCEMHHELRVPSWRDATARHLRA